MTKRKIELLAPAKNIEIAIEAINHGADAVYIGASSHGARQSAANSIDDISKLVDYAHKFNVRVYVTVNTLVYDNELKQVEKLINSLYRVGTDALIVQDMGLLRMDIPPIELHASTQCDTRTVEKAQFLEQVGFSQIVLARELSVSEITDICKNVKARIETFIHGALCVSYSGRCHASAVARHRSANRGECAQLCRLPYTLNDSNNHCLVKNKHLLSLRDFNASDLLSELMNAGVSSFKIEGRLKDADYVKNIVSYYRKLIDYEISNNSDKYCRSSIGKSIVEFDPNPYKSFNRGFTHYFLTERKPNSIASIYTPKSLGEPIKSIKQINNGDGISYFTKSGEYSGVRVNKIENNRIFTANKTKISNDIQLYRTFDRVWDTALHKETAKRKIDVDFCIDDNGVSAVDESGCKVRLRFDQSTKEHTKKKSDLSLLFGKLGNTIYRLNKFIDNRSFDYFIPASQLTSLRRSLIDLLDKNRQMIYGYNYRCPENKNIAYPEHKNNNGEICMDYRGNVANKLAYQFYKQHRVDDIELAIEVQEKSKLNNPIIVMTCRHCILRELGWCKKCNTKKLNEPLTLSNGREIFTLKFDCKKCEMQLLLDV